MQAGDLLVGSLGVLAFVVLCAGLVMRRGGSRSDLEQLEQQAREHQRAQVQSYRDLHS